MNLANIYVGDLQSAKECLRRSAEKARTARDHFMASRLDMTVAEIERAEAEHMEKRYPPPATKSRIFLATASFIFETLA